MNIKDYLFKHVEKYSLGLTVCYLLYILIYTIIVLHRETHGINSKILSFSGTIEGKLKTSKPPAIDTELEKAAHLERRFTDPPAVNVLQRPRIFCRFTDEGVISDITTRDLMKKSELHTLPHLMVDTQGDTEFIYKGGTAELALVLVRKLYKEKWWVESFTVEKGNTIGEKKTIGKEKVDFSTHCKLKEIVPDAQKPLVVKKTAVLRNDKGEFLGTSLTEETHMISASRIVFEDKKGGAYNLWVGELVNLGTETVATRSSANISSND